MTDRCETIEVDPRTDPRWEALQVHGGSLFTSAPWIQAVVDTYGLTPSARLVVADGEVRAGVAYCDIDDPRGRRLISFPFSDYHEPLGASLTDVGALLGTFPGSAPVRFRIPASRVPAGSADAGLTEQRLLLRHRIEVDPGLDSDERFAGLHPKVRQNIRRSRKAGVETELSSDLAQLREFYDLHVDVRTRKYRLLPQPFSFFEAIHSAFAPTGAMTVALARLDGRAIAGIVYLRMGDTLYYKFNASKADDLNVRPNEDLIWAGSELCAAEQLSGIDLGISDTDQEGLVRYKRKLAAFEEDIVTLSAEGEEVDPHAHRGAEVSALLSRLTQLFTDDAVPPHIAQQAGAELYRYFV